MRDCLLKYEFMDGDIYKLYEDDPSSKEVCKTFETISASLRKSKKSKPIEKYLIFFLFATHGILKDGKQFIFVNEFNHNQDYYYRIAIESKLRSWASIFPHSYLISIFACCRQLYNEKTMVGFSRD